MSKPAIQLAPERHAQLKQMAANMGGVNISEALAKLIELAQNEGLISHEIQGVKISALSDGLAIKFDEGETVGFSYEEAAWLAAGIHAFLAGERNKKFASRNYAVKGRGQGIAISIPAESEGSKVFDRGLADEFARLLERAAPATA